MQKVRVIATALLYLSRLLAVPYLATALYIIVCFLFSNQMVHPLDGGQRFALHYPFTSTNFLIGDEYRFIYIFEMIAFIGLYGVFFWMLGNIFKTFREQKLFTRKGVQRLKVFYLLNFLAPLPFLIRHLADHYEVSTIVILTVLHWVLGIFAYFMAVIFSRGLQLQNEQDLIF
ncbi:DUF2975 domain-containing protein [Niabella pedocola]|uniref:DUF2975 domain-containing protein n=1 Tax=Niabella pedocola TaxID=1752077 RepID=A0ABS8PV14_9BACT|nr:DUF2975 domain-containing protein [Niabella pedocola]MCD2424917.1 DUF2975 domain-containing protein [Niabella pedocola]